MTTPEPTPPVTPGPKDPGGQTDGGYHHDSEPTTPPPAPSTGGQ